jgi:hypothetical protein
MNAALTALAALATVIAAAGICSIPDRPIDQEGDFAVGLLAGLAATVFAVITLVLVFKF